MSSAKTAEPIEMPFGIWTRVGATWQMLTEPSMCGGDAACCQITLATCYYRACVKGKGKEEYLYSAFLHQGTLKALSSKCTIYPGFFF